MASRQQKRGHKQFPRKTKLRPEKKAILIVCEGKCTEPDYLKYITREWKINPKLVYIRIVGGDTSGSAPISIVGHAKEQRDERKTNGLLPFESIWCVFDVEVPQHHSLLQAISQAKDLEFNVALTNPAFEYWLLLHFKDTSSQLTSSKQAMVELRKHIPSFKKNLSDEMMEKIFPHIPTAIKRAEQRFRKHSVRELADTNPSTHVYKLVEELQSQGID